MPDRKKSQRRMAIILSVKARDIEMRLIRTMAAIQCLQDEITELGNNLAMVCHSRAMSDGERIATGRLYAETASRELIDRQARMVELLDKRVALERALSSVILGQKILNAPGK